MSDRQHIHKYINILMHANLCKHTQKENLSLQKESTISIGPFLKTTHST